MINSTIFRFVFLFLIVILSLSQASSLTYLNIYLDESGNAEFYGETNISELDLPGGINLDNGKIRGTTTNLTSKTGDKWSFSYSLPDSEMKIILPEDTVISDISIGELYIDNNKFVVYSSDEASFSYTFNYDQKKGNTFLLIVLVTIFIIFLYFGFIFYKRKINSNDDSKKNNFNKMHIIREVLSDRENIILDNLKKTGKIKMSYLRKMCNLPKASFSRHLQELEKKGLIKRTGEGKNKFVDVK